MPPRAVLSNQQLVEYSGEHLLYELQIFRWLVETLPTKAKGFELSALLESFAIHLRNLVDFFYIDSNRADDVIAADFYDPASNWRPGQMSATLEEARERANKEVGHITHKRKTGADPNKPWKVAQLFNEVDGIARKFVAGASRAKLHQDVITWLTSPPNQVVMLMVNASTSTSNTVAQVVMNGPATSGAPVLPNKTMP